MKAEEIIFTYPLTVIEIFSNVQVYIKDKKSFDVRKEQNKWKDIKSVSGYVANNELWLPEQIFKNPDFKNCGFITIEESIHAQHLPATKQAGEKNAANHNWCFRLSKAITHHIFTFQKKETLELHLKYDHFEIGEPERDNFKICELKKGQPIEIKINGKTDSTLFSGAARTFIERQYILNYLGDFDRCKLIKGSGNFIIKQLPAKRKLIDLMKPLW